jgi:hypothetical protein
MELPGASHVSLFEKLMESYPGSFEWGGYFNTSNTADPKGKIISTILKQTQGPIDDQTSTKFMQMLRQSIDD